MALESDGESTVMLVCGEPSGDLHASELVAELKHMADVRVVAAGGPRLAAAGADVRWDSTFWGSIGLPEALCKLPGYLRSMLTLQARVAELRPDLLLLVDFGAYNLRLAARLRARLPRLPIFYYFPPASWDRKRRYYTNLLRVTDYVATPFPWNAALLAAQGATVRWVGHPAVDRVRPPEDKAEAKRAVGADPGATVLGLLPGSRLTERGLLGETFLRAAEELRRRMGRLEVLWSSTPGSKQVDWLLGVGARREWARPVPDTAALLRAADVGLCCFGTVTIEAALAGCPIVGAYRLTRALQAVASFMHLATSLYSMPNIVAGEPAVPELVQDDATPANLADAALELLDGARSAPAGGSRLARVSRAYEKVRVQMGPPGAAKRAAEMVVEALQGKLPPHTRAVG